MEENKPKRNRRTKAEMDAIRNASIATTLNKSVSNVVNNTSEGVSEGEEEDEACRAYFFIDSGKEQIKVEALKNCWVMKRMIVVKDKPEWVGFKWVSDLGSVANRIFDMRLKNCEARSLKELSSYAKSIGDAVREEFRLKKERAK